MLIIDSDSRGKDVRKSYPSLILGFVKFQGDDKVMVFVQTAESDFPWENIKKEFVSSFEIGTELDVSYDLVTVTSSSLFILYLSSNITAVNQHSSSALSPR